MVKYLYLDGVDDNINFGDFTGTGISDPSVWGKLTIEFWLNVKGGYYILSSGGQTSSSGIAISYHNGSPLFWLKNGSKHWKVNPVMTKNEWVLWSVVWDGAKLEVFKNGVSVGVDNNPVNISTTSNQKVLTVGRPNHTTGFYGNFDIRELRIWNAVKTSSEIQTTMNSQLTGMEANLEYYWKIDEGSGSTVYDSTSEPRNGTLTGGTWLDDGTGGTTGTSVAVTSVTANTNASTVAPSVTTEQQLFVSSVVANASAEGIAPILSMGANIAGVAGVATAESLIPQVGSFTNIMVNAVIANTTASANAPNVGGIRNISVSAIVTNATASALVPNVGSTVSAQITSVIANLTADAVVPSMSTSQGIQIASAVAGAFAQGVSPTLRTDAIISTLIANLQAVGIAPTVTLNAEVVVGRIRLKAKRDLYIYLEAKRELVISLKGGIDMAATNQNFTRHAGDSMPIILDAGEVLTGCTAKWALKQRVISPEHLIYKDTTNGITINGSEIHIKLDPVDTANLKGDYYHECEVTDASGNVTTVTTGMASILPSGV